jgi:RNA recognition motif-containing protein
MAQLFLSNVPWNCPEADVQHWIESNGFPVHSIHSIRDLEAKASPEFAYVTLRDNTQNGAAIEALNGHRLKDRILQVKVDWREGHKGPDGAGSSRPHD